MASKEISGNKKMRSLKSVQSDSTVHIKEIPRLKRIKGQIDGIARMIEDKRYCVEILQQVKAARSAVLALENSILTTHLDSCVRDAFKTKNKDNAALKIREISEFLNR